MGGDAVWGPGETTRIKSRVPRFLRLRFADYKT